MDGVIVHHAIGFLPHHAKSQAESAIAMVSAKPWAWPGFAIASRANQGK
jgi:hypothetical protein